MGRSRSEVAERLVPWICGVLFALPVLVTKYPPMDDLPLHEACVGLLRHWGDARFAPPSVYMLNLGHANQLFSFLVLALAYPLPIAWASKVAVALLLFSLPLSAAHAARHLGATAWASLLVAPLGLGWLFYWGLVQNLLGLVVFLWLLPAIDRFVDRPSARGIAAMCGATTLLFFAHEVMLFIACGAFVFCSIGTSFRPKVLARRVAPLVYASALIVAGRIYDWHVAGVRDYTAPKATYLSLQHKLVSIPGVLFGGFEHYVRDLMMVVALFPVVLLIVARVRTVLPDGKGLAMRLRPWRFELLAVTLFAAYLAGPATVGSTTLVYHRFLPPTWAVLAISAGSGLGKGTRLIPRLLCAALPFGTLLISWPAFADSNQVYSDLEPLLKQIEIGSTVATLSIGPGPSRLWSTLDADGHIIAERGGKSLYDYTQSPISPVVQRPRKRWENAHSRTDGSSLAFRPDWDLTWFRYVVVNVPNPGYAVVTELAFGKRVRLVGQSGGWLLFESQLPLVPIDSEDAPLPSPHPATLRKLFQDIAKQMEPDSQSHGEPHS